MTSTTTIKVKDGITWINIVNASKADLTQLKRKFKFLEIDLKDSYPNQNAQRPKFYLRHTYAFLILQFPIYNTKQRVVTPEEVDFFIGPDYIITCHKNKLPALVGFFNLCHSDRFYREQYLSDSTMTLLYEIIERLQENCYPMLDHLSLDVRNIEKNIFAGRERRMVTEILSIKRNVLNFRKSISSHKNVLKKVINSDRPFFPIKSSNVVFSHLIEHTKNIWEILDSQKEMIEALEDTNSSLVSFKLNDIMRTLTIFSVIILPLSLIAGIFGMNVVEMPIVSDAHAFWVLLGIMGVAGLGMLLFFKRKEWL